MFVTSFFSLELQRSLFTRDSAGFTLFKGWGQSPLSAGERKVLIASKKISQILLLIQFPEVAQSHLVVKNYCIEETNTAPKA